MKSEFVKSDVNAMSPPEMVGEIVRLKAELRQAWATVAFLAAKYDAPATARLAIAALAKLDGW